MQRCHFCAATLLARDTGAPSDRVLIPATTAPALDPLLRYLIGPLASAP